MKVEIEVDADIIPRGYELIGYRKGGPGEIISMEVLGEYRAREINYTTSGYVPILRKLPPPEPKYRAWKDRSEVPVGEVRFIEFYCADGKPSHSGYWWTVRGVGPKDIDVFGVDPHRKSFDDLFNDRAIYSPDGKTWHKCGVLES